MQPKRPRNSNVHAWHGTQPVSTQQETQHQDNETTFEINNDEFNNSSNWEVIMACTCSTAGIGVAVYDRLQNSLSVMQSHDDVKGPGSYQLLQLIKLQTNPNVIYVSSKSDTAFIDACKQPVSSVGQEGYTVRLERNSIFQYEKTLRQLENLHVAGTPQGLQSKQHLRMLNSMMDLSREQQVAALGALLFIIHKAGLHPETSREDGRDDMCEDGAVLSGNVAVDVLQELNLHGYLMLDPPTLLGLGLFQEEKHPSLMGIGKPKEGFSVFGMMQRCITNMGRRLMRLWFLRPVVNLAVLNDRQDTIELLVNAPELMVAIKGILKKVQDLPKLLQKLQEAQLRPDAKCFQQLLTSLLQLSLLRDLFQQLAPKQLQSPQEQDESDVPNIISWSNVSISHKVLTNITDQLLNCHDLISNIIDFDQDDGMLISYGICDELDELKHTYHSLPNFLTQVVEEELKSIPSVLAQRNRQQLWSIVYIPQIGYLMQVMGEPLTEDLLEALPDYKRAFETQTSEGPATMYYTNTTYELNAKFGDMLYKIQDLEACLCAELVKRLVQFAPQLQRVATVVAELDCLMCWATCARDLKYCRPTLTTDNVLHIEKGRHPLTEMLVDTFIPNDTHLAEDSPRIQIVTGPNASGKSCYIKQVAIIVYLAHLGAFVPADAAVIGLTDRIFARIVSHETMRLQQSTFMMDLSQVACMLNNSTGRSLIILDEFGKGSLMSDGVGLLSACLCHFSQLPASPKMIAATHFHEVFVPDILPRHPKIEFVTMDVLAAGEGPEGVNTSIFLYKLTPGYSLPSFGLYCAQMCGVKQEVIQLAKKVVAAQQKGSPLQQHVMLNTIRSKAYLGCLQSLQMLQLEGSSSQQDVLSRRLSDFVQQICSLSH